MKFKAKYLQNTTQQLIFKQFIEVSIEITSFSSNFQQKVILKLHKILFRTAQTCRTTYLKKALHKLDIRGGDGLSVNRSVII